MTAREMEPVPQQQTQGNAWHTFDADTVLAHLATSPQGLPAAEIERRREHYGPNTLPKREPPTLWNIVLHQVMNPLIYILIAAAVLALITGDAKDAIFIAVVIGLNTALGMYQEYQAEQSASALQNLLKVQAKVRRDGNDGTLEAEALVPGDIVLLESGDRVPADLRLLNANNLRVDESFLTGESVAIDKHPAMLDTPDLSIGDRINLAYSGSTVMGGRGTGVVVATGLATELGKIAKAATEEGGTKPPLVLRMERFVRYVSFIVLAAVALLVVISVAQGTPFVDVFFLAVALAVSAIPEGLPIAMTVALSIAVRRMARRNVIVRQMPAVEGLGSCTMIASDKTGTLTVNKQTVRVLALPDGTRFEVTGEGYNGKGEVHGPNGAKRDEAHQLVRAAVIVNEASLRPQAEQNGEWQHAGDAVDVALLAVGYKMGDDVEYLRRSTEIVAEIPFESERKFAATAYRAAGNELVAVKGATETVLDFCHAVHGASGTSGLNRQAVERQAEQLAQDGYRVIAVAQGRLNGTLDEHNLPPLTLLGLVGMIDPLRPEAKAAVETAKRAGVAVAMITGDHPATALAIARDLGIAASGDDLATGRELPDGNAENEPAFAEAVERVRVFARVSPLQKLRIVEALTNAGHFVAVTGDGVNDAPAMRAANIGVAMGSGTDVAKDTASIIATDDNFASIVDGVEEGRFAYDNIRKVIYLLISAGAAEIILFLLAIIVGLPIPLLAVQILWLNLVTNGIQDVALAFEGGEPGAMQRPPRKPAEGIFNGLMIGQVALSGATMGLIAFGAWYWLLQSGLDEFSARNLVLLLMVLFQNYHVFNCRSEYVSAFRVPLRRNWVLAVGVVAALGLHLLAMYIPFMRDILQVGPVSLTQFLFLAALASTVLIVMEMFKAARGGRRPQTQMQPALR